jgi:DNA modification methylase
MGVKKGKPTFNSSYDKGIYEYPICHDKGRFHPTQKPVALIEELILKHSRENDLILDCFSGSGTTAVAAYNTNRNFTGCEKSDKYFEKSQKRIHMLIEN